MRNWTNSLFSRGFAVTAISALFITAAAAQAPAAARAGVRPNLNGIWQAVNTANYNLEGHAAEASPIVAMGALGAVPGGLGVVEGGPIPYLPAAAAKRKQNYADRMKLDPEVKCYLPGVPRATYMPFPFQIVQTAEFILISYEYANAVRTIYMKDPGPPPVDSWMGQSVGHWEGNTLVVDAKGFNEDSWLDRSGNFHSDALHVVERYTPRGNDVIMYEATLEDPMVYSRPWKISMPLYRRLDKNMQLLEFKCQEFVEELLYGQFRKK